MIGKLRNVLLVVLAATVLPVGQPRGQGLDDGQFGLQHKQLRELRQRSLTAPVGDEALRQERRLESQSLGGRDARTSLLRRQLRELPATVLEPIPAQEEADRGFRRFDPSPNADQQERQDRRRATAPGGGDVLTTASRLIQRAGEAEDRGDRGRALADAAFARRLLDGLGPPATAPRLATARARLTLWDARLGGPSPPPSSDRAP